ncbi:SAM-dependent methyltransferase [Paucibacter oligotrophus]|uniref:SAM-dependent methyltransferase n=1 Tax=Roseateles oligotrophus TaxID=1769250 RepID=A0A840L4S5_9BURK|nr:class I SAM-dependent methyltransferase [Roseateles oligotrophus]MBB4843210.1 SAM-dependent methyltransferase [Roseateles oligotrophus]
MNEVSATPASRFSSMEDDLHLFALLRSSDDLGLTHQLMQAASNLTELQTSLGTNAGTLSQILDGLQGFGVIGQRADAYEINEEWKAYLGSATRHHQSAGVRRGLQAVDRWRRLPEIAKDKLQAAEKSAESQMFGSGIHLEQYLLAVRDENTEHARTLAHQLAERLQTSEGRFLDMAGGHGKYAFELLNLCPHAIGTLADLPQTLAVFERLSAEEPARNRLRAMVCDATRDELPQQAFDLILMNDLLHSFDRQTKVEVLRRVARGLAPGGVLVVSKFGYQDPAKEVENALFSLRLHVNSHGGYLEKDGEMPGLFEAAGLKIDSVLQLGPKLSYLLSGVTVSQEVH